MKTKIIIAVLLMGIVSNAYGQFVDGESVAMSDYERILMNDENGTRKLKGEWNGQITLYYATMDEDGLDAKFFLGLDLVGVRYISDRAFVRGGLGYMSGFRRVKYDRGTFATASENQLNIPLQIGFALSLTERSDFNLYTGPRVNYIFSGKMEMEYPGEKPVVTRYKDIDGIKRSSVNWNIGGILDVGSLADGAVRWGVTAEYRAALSNDSPNWFHIGLFMSLRTW